MTGQYSVKSQHQPSNGTCNLFNFNLIIRNLDGYNLNACFILIIHSFLISCSGYSIRNVKCIFLCLCNESLTLLFCFDFINEVINQQ